MKGITVFCGSSFGSDEIFRTQAMLLGETLAQRRITVIYGGTKIGLMGALAEAALGAGGNVVGVLPHFLSTKEIAHEGLTELVMVESMHDRKTKMHDLCDGIIALPGGYGTMEELFEILTWAQLGLHRKPIGLLNINGYYDHLKMLIQTMVEKQFLKEINQKMLLISDDILQLLDAMSNYKAPVVGKWITKDEV